jgi:cysteine synthase
MSQTAIRVFRRSMAIYSDITKTVGRTPIVKINKLAPPGVDVYAKCEFFNPLSSVKDRLALAVIEHGELTGALKPGQTVIEATSGNTGISLAMMCAQRGHPCVIVMAESFSVERRKIMRQLGAKVVLTPASERGSGMVKKAIELADKHGWFLARQFENEANRAYHMQTTGPEIVQDFAGRRLDYFVIGYGTGGTFAGTGAVIRLARPEVKIVLSEPASAALVTSGKPQERMPDGSPAKTHPAFTPRARSRGRRALQPPLGASCDPRVRTPRLRAAHASSPCARRARTPQTRSRAGRPTSSRSTCRPA